MKTLNFKLLNLLYLVLVAVIFIGCESRKITKPLTLVSTNGSGWSMTSSYLRCDSVQMVSTTEAYVWIDGSKMKVVAENVRVYSNGN